MQFSFIHFAYFLAYKKYFFIITTAKFCFCIGCLDFLPTCNSRRRIVELHTFVSTKAKSPKSKIFLYVYFLHNFNKYASSIFDVSNFFSYWYFFLTKHNSVYIQLQNSTNNNFINFNFLSNLTLTNSGCCIRLNLFLSRIILLKLFCTAVELQLLNQQH